MIKNHSWFVKCIFLVISFISLSSILYAASKRKKTAPQEKTAISPRETPAKNSTPSYFSSISVETMLDIENGSPSSLRRAASALRKTTVEYTTSEKVLLEVASEIMQMVYPSERVGWETPAYSEANPYIGAIKSAKIGIYDTSTGFMDFLSFVLPSLVITRVDDVSYFFDLSKTDLEKALSLNNTSVLANYLMGTLYKKAGKHTEATPYFLAAKEGAPDCFETLYAYAENLYLLGRVSEANYEIHPLLEKYPANPEVLRIAAQIAFDAKKYNEAEDYILRILQQNPNDLEALLFRTKILVIKKDYIRAASLLDVYSRQDSASKDYLLLRAELQYDWSKNLNATIATIENALRLYPDDKEVQLFAAKICAVTGTKIAGKSAEDYANAVLAVDETNQTALRYAVVGLMEKKDFQKAYELSSKLLKIGSDDENLFLHVRICLALKKNDEAWNLISPVYRTNSADENVIQTYIITLDETDRDQQALTLINKLLPDASSRLKSFLHYRRSLLQTREEDALSDLRSSLISNPRNTDSLFRLYQIYFSKNDYRKAQYYLKQIVALNPNDEEVRKLNDELLLLLK